MSTECNKSLAECEKKLAYYKEMYEMRTHAYITLHRQFDLVNDTLQATLAPPTREDILKIYERAMER